MEERCPRVRGTPIATHLKAAQKKFSTFNEAAATEWKRLKAENAKRTLTPDNNPIEHARWVHLCEIKQKKG